MYGIILKTLTCTSNISLSENVTNQTITIDADFTNFGNVSNCFNKTEVTTLSEEQIIDHGGAGISISQFNSGGPIPKNHLSRFFGDPPIIVNKYSDALNPAIDENISIGIDLSDYYNKNH